MIMRISKEREVKSCTIVTSCALRELPLTSDCLKQYKATHPRTPLCPAVYLLRYHMLWILLAYVRGAIHNLLPRDHQRLYTNTL